MLTMAMPKAKVFNWLTKIVAAQHQALISIFIHYMTEQGRGIDQQQWHQSNLLGL